MRKRVAMCAAVRARPWLASHVAVSSGAFFSFVSGLVSGDRGSVSPCARRARFSGETSMSGGHRRACVAPRGSLSAMCPAHGRSRASRLEGYSRVRARMRRRRVYGVCCSGRAVAREARQLALSSYHRWSVVRPAYRRVCGCRKPGAHTRCGRFRVSYFLVSFFCGQLACGRRRRFHVWLTL